MCTQEKLFTLSDRRMQIISDRISRKPDILLFGNGRIDISARVANMLSLELGDVVDIALRDGEYHLYVSHKNPIARYDARVRPTKKRSRNFRCNSVRLARYMLSAVGRTMSARLPAGESSSYCGVTSVIIIPHALD